MPALTNSINELKKAMRKYAHSELTFTKKADLGSGGQDMSFEQAFSNLAHTYLKDKAPGLLDYEIGFQLIERNQDNTKAIGVFGFKVGNQWIYAPVFFLNGDLKGHELLYIKNQDMFVPMKENWLNYLLNRRPSILGEHTSKDLTSLGVLSPNFYQLSRSPAKFASDRSKDVNLPDIKLAEWAKEVMPDLAYFACTSPDHDPKFANTRNLLDFIKDAGSEVIPALVNMCEDYPNLRVLLNQTYGESNLNQAIKEAAQKDAWGPMCNKAKYRNKKKMKKRSSDLSSLIANNESPFITKKAEGSAKITVTKFKRIESKMGIPGLGSNLSDEQKEKLLGGHIVIEDSRDDKEITISYDIDVPTSLQTVKESGLYDVLIKPFEFRKCLVIIGPYSNMGQKTFCTVVDLENKDYINTHPSNVFSKAKYERDVFEKWFKDLPDGEVSKDGLQMLIGPTGQGTLPFSVDKSNSGELETYDVYFRSYASSERAGSYPRYQEENKYHDTYSESKKTGTSRLVCTERDGKSLRAMGEELLVPSRYKVIKLKSGDSFLCLGTATDFHTGIYKHGGLDTMVLRSNGSHFSINNAELDNFNNTLENLVTVHGFREKQAMDMMDMAKEDKVHKFLVKYAYPDYPMQRSGPTAPPIPEPVKSTDPMTGGMVQTQPSQEWLSTVPGMNAQVYDRNVYDVRPQAYSQPNMVGSNNSDSGGKPPKPDDKAMQSAMQSAQSGQKEIFDTTMIGSLLKTVRDDSMVDKYLGDLMKGMDRLARILFLFYWHSEKFEERYGKDDMPELEDSLRNAFEAMGDIVLFLKQKTIEPYPDEAGNIDLGAISE